MLRILGVLLLCVATFIGAAGPAAAAAPNWSGLDARGYSGWIPAPGEWMASEPLDPVLWVTGAAAGYRVLYSTTNQHNQPAVGTAAVFTPQARHPTVVGR